MGVPHRAMPDITTPPRANGIAQDRSGSWRSPHVQPHHATPPWAPEPHVDPRLTAQGTAPTRQLPPFVPYAYLDPQNYYAKPQ